MLHSTSDTSSLSFVLTFEYVMDVGYASRAYLRGEKTLHECICHVVTVLCVSHGVAHVATHSHVALPP
jgi:hypothetical protein